MFARRHDARRGRPFGRRPRFRGAGGVDAHEELFVDGEILGLERDVQRRSVDVDDVFDRIRDRGSAERLGREHRR